MAYNDRTGLEFMEGFSLLAGALWLIGALAIGALVMLGNARTGTAAPAAVASEVGGVPATQ